MKRLLATLMCFVIIALTLCSCSAFMPGGNTDDDDCEHDYSIWEVLRETTCTKNGIKERECSICGDVERDQIPAREHNYVNGSCTYCGDETRTDNNERPTDTNEDVSGYECEHEFGEWITVKTPTCISTGTQKHYCNKCNYSETSILNLVGHTYWGSICSVCGAQKPDNSDTYTRIDADGNKDASGEYILFGSYPQTEVTDTTLTSTLTSAAGTLPTSDNSQGWTSYGYYMGTGSTGSQSNTTDYMWYIDIENGGETYRGVYFDQYRPYWTSDTSSYTYQDDNGYTTSNVYWFKYEPIKWRILDEENGAALILCEMLIDSQAYQNCYTYSSDYYYATDDDGNILTDENGNKIYANNYAYSTVRAWLNDNFYNTAFNDLQKELIQLTTVDNSAATTDSSTNKYECENTDDNIFLLSYQDILNSEYGFSSDYLDYDEARQKLTTDYAQCQGVWTSTSTDYAGNGYWWLRSPYYNYSLSARGVYYYGYAYYDLGDVGHTGSGVCPALWILL